MNLSNILQIIFIILLILVITLLSVHINEVNKENFKDCNYYHKQGKKMKHTHYGLLGSKSCPEHKELTYKHDHKSNEELLFTLTGETTKWDRDIEVKFIINFYSHKHKDPVDGKLRCEIKALYDNNYSTTGTPTPTNTTLKNLEDHNILIYEDSYSKFKNKWWLFNIAPNKTDIDKIQTLCGDSVDGYSYKKENHYIYNLWEICNRREKSTMDRYIKKLDKFNGGFYKKNNEDKAEKCYRGKEEEENNIEPNENEKNIPAFDKDCNTCLFSKLTLTSITNLKPYLKLTFFNLKNSCKKTLEKTLENDVVKESEESLEITSNNEKIDEETSFSSFSIEYDAENKERHELMNGIKFCNNKDFCPDDTSIMISTMNNFEEHSKLKNLIIDKRITSIPNNAFKNITTLEKVYIPSNLEKIGSEAFSLTSGEPLDNELEIIFFPHHTESKLNTLGEKVFMNRTNLKSITLPESLKEIKSQAFKGVDLEIIKYKNETYNVQQFKSIFSDNITIAQDAFDA